ncbi:MAG: GAF domain-containing protein, partial [Candidatus Eremiobacteraeota bacterium]|nr:GAF domain-containing protein [Candidatus Eremiobacteraeota bacterium]
EEAQSVIVLDSGQDPIFSGCECRFRSALCVPVPDPEGNVVGLLYADDAGAGRFSYQDRNNLEDYAADLGQQLMEVDWDEKPPEPTPPPPPRPPREPLPKPLRIAAWLFAVACVWVVLGGAWIGLRSQQVEQPNGLPPVSAETEAMTVARSVLSMLQTDDFQLLRQRLTDSARSRSSTSDFSARLKKWLAKPERRDDLQRRQLLPKENGPTTSKVLVRSDGQEDWTWTFTYNGIVWQLERAEGGPPLTN